MNYHISLIKENPKKFFAGRYTVSVMLEHRGKLLLVQEAVGKIRGKWSQPAGHIELNETPFQAALRECKEETGYTVKITGLFRVYFMPAKKKANAYVNYTFLARPVGRPSQKITKEIMTTQWYSKKELKTFPVGAMRSTVATERVNDWLKGHRAIPLSYLREIKK